MTSTVWAIRWGEGGWCWLDDNVVSCYVDVLDQLVGFSSLPFTGPQLYCGSSAGTIGFNINYIGLSGSLP